MEISKILGHEGLDIGGTHPFLIKHNCRNLYFAIYVAWLFANTPEMVTEEMCKYNVLPIHEFFKNKKEINMESIRQFVSKISVHEDSIGNIATDILHHIPNAKKYRFIEQAAHFEHMCATTQGHRKPLYMELIMNIAAFGLSIT
jgi:hypothetical protein